MRRGYVWRVALAALLVLSIAVSPALADEEDEEDAGGTQDPGSLLTAIERTTVGKNVADASARSDPGMYAG